MRIIQSRPAAVPRPAATHLCSGPTSEDRRRSRVGCSDGVGSRSFAGSVLLFLLDGRADGFVSFWGDEDDFHDFDGGRRGEGGRKSSSPDD